MRVKVSKDQVNIIDSDYMIHKGEYRVNGIEYEFEDEYNDLTCKAIFNDGNNTVEVPITLGTSIIPYEVLSSGASKCELRVYGYETEEVEENGETTTKLKLRYSPAYTEFDIRRGSYIPNASSTEEITPSQFEQYCQALEEGLQEVDSRLEEADIVIEQANNLDIDVEKTGKVATVTITDKTGTDKSVNVYDGDSGIVLFEIDNGHLIAISENPANYENYYISNGHLYLDIN